MTVWQLFRRLLGLVLGGRGGDEVCAALLDECGDPLGAEYEVSAVVPAKRDERFVTVWLSWRAGVRPMVDDDVDEWRSRHPIDRALERD